MKKSICGLTLHLGRSKAGWLFLLATMVLLGCGVSTGPATNSSGGSNPGSPTNPTPSVEDYYVSTSGSDSNNGSSSAPWRTIQHAANVVTNGIVHVGPGTYAEAVDINNSLKNPSPVTFISDTQYGARVIGTASSNYSFYVEDDNVSIVGFDISATNAYQHQGILDIGSYFYAVGNRVHDIDAIGGQDGQGGAGILLGNSQGSGYSCCGYAFANVVYHIGNFTIPWASTHGIYIEEPYGIIANNITYENQGCGIQLWHNPSNIVVANNTIFNNGMCGIVVGAVFTPPDTIATNNYVFNNIVVYNGTNSNAECGIYEDGNVGTNYYPNNLGYGNNPNGNHDFCLLNGNTAPNSVIAEPAFVDYQADGGGNYDLQSTSPAINAGVNYEGYAPYEDFAGGRRPAGSSWDIGAYEYGATPLTATVPPTASWSSTGGGILVTVAVNTNADLSVTCVTLNDSMTMPSTNNDGLTCAHGAALQPNYFTVKSSAVLRIVSGTANSGDSLVNTYNITVPTTPAFRDR